MPDVYIEPRITIWVWVVHYYFINSIERLIISDIARIEEDVQNVINAEVPVSRSLISSAKLMEMQDVTLIPGEVYPLENISIIEIENNGFISK